MSLLGLFTACKSQKNDNDKTDGTKKEKPTMPQGQLNKLEYNYSGMRIERFSDFELQRKKDGNGATLKFRHFNREDLSFEVSDTLLDAARRIIEEDKMYEYGISYSIQIPDGERILDGFSWYFSATFEDQQSIYSKGYHASPDGDGLYHISQLLYDAAEKCVNDSENKE